LEQDLQKQKEANEEELLGLQKDDNEKKSKVDDASVVHTLFDLMQVTRNQ